MSDTRNKVNDFPDYAAIASGRLPLAISSMTTATGFRAMTPGSITKTGATQPRNASSPDKTKAQYGTTSPGVDHSFGPRLTIGVTPSSGKVQVQLTASTAK
jgi:hypothetical protein